MGFKMSESAKKPVPPDLSAILGADFDKLLSNTKRPDAAKTEAKVGKEAPAPASASASSAATPIDTALPPVMPLSMDDEPTPATEIVAMEPDNAAPSQEKPINSHDSLTLPEGTGFNIAQDILTSTGAAISSALDSQDFIDGPTENDISSLASSQFDPLNSANAATSSSLNMDIFDAVDDPGPEQIGSDEVSGISERTVVDTNIGVDFASLAAEAEAELAAETNTASSAESPDDDEYNEPADTMIIPMPFPVEITPPEGAQEDFKLSDAANNNPDDDFGPSDALNADSADDDLGAIDVVSGDSTVSDFGSTNVLNAGSADNDFDASDGVSPDSADDDFGAIDVVSGNSPDGDFSPSDAVKADSADDDFGAIDVVSADSQNSDSGASSQSSFNKPQWHTPQAPQARPKMAEATAGPTDQNAIKTVQLNIPTNLATAMSLTASKIPLILAIIFAIIAIILGYSLQRASLTNKELEKQLAVFTTPQFFTNCGAISELDSRDNCLYRSSFQREQCLLLCKSHNNPVKCAQICENLHNDCIAKCPEEQEIIETEEATEEDDENSDSLSDEEAEEATPNESPEENPGDPNNQALKDPQATGDNNVTSENNGETAKDASLKKEVKSSASKSKKSSRKKSGASSSKKDSRKGTATTSRKTSSKRR